jgi:hypothetical protein
METQSEMHTALNAIEAAANRIASVTAFPLMPIVCVWRAVRPSDSISWPPR